MWSLRLAKLVWIHLIARANYPNFAGACLRPSLGIITAIVKASLIATYWGWSDWSALSGATSVEVALEGGASDEMALAVLVKAPSLAI